MQGTKKRRAFKGFKGSAAASVTKPLNKKVGGPIFVTERAKDSSKGTSPKIDKQNWLLLIVNGLYAAANALSGAFVNVYLWRAKNDFAMIGWFALAHQVTMMLTFWISGKWVKEHNKMHCLRLGIAINAVFYLTVLLLGKQSVNYVPVLGIVQGLSSGFFWLAFNVVYFEVTNAANRDKFNGWAGLLGSGAGMIAPWLSGFIISRMTNTSGYRIIFSISLGVFVVAVIFSLFLAKRKPSGHYEWLHSVQQFKQEGNPWRSIAPALVFQGIREGVFGFMIGLLVYIATKQELKLGNFSLITSAVAFITFWVVGKWLRPRFRAWSMIIGAIAIVLVIIPFFWKVSYFTLLVFGITTSLFIPLYTIPMTSVVFDMIGKDEESSSHRVEFVVLREIALNAGRIMGTLLFVVVISWTQSKLAINVLLLIIGCSPIGAALIMRRFVRSAKTRKAGTS